MTSRKVSRANSQFFFKEGHRASTAPQLNQPKEAAMKARASPFASLPLENDLADGASS
jgi:hypothetical protein